MKTSPPMTHAGQNRTEKSADHVDQNCSKENPFPYTCWVQKSTMVELFGYKGFKELFSYHYTVLPYARQVSESAMPNFQMFVQYTKVPGL